MNLSKCYSLNHSLCACFALTLEGGHELEGELRSMWGGDPEGAA